MTGSPGPCVLIPRERGWVSQGQWGEGQRQVRQVAPGMGADVPPHPAEWGAQEPGVWCTSEKVLGPDWGGEQGGQHSGGGLGQGRSRGAAAVGSASRVFTPHTEAPFPTSQSPPEPFCRLLCGLEQVPGHLWALPSPL